MFIILEGPDGAGKTTFAEALRERTGGAVLHRGPPQRPVFEEYVHSVEHYVPGGGRTIIADRWHWGELVYGPLYREQSELGAQGMSVVDGFLRRKGAIVVYLTLPWEELRRRCETRGDDYIRLDDLEAIHLAYERVAEKSTLPVLHLRNPGHTHVHDVIAIADVFERAANGRWSHENTSA